MPQDLLYNHVRHAESVQVACEATAESVPAVPLRKRFVPLILVPVRFVIGFCFPAEPTINQDSTASQHGLINVADHR